MARAELIPEKTETKVVVHPATVTLTLTVDEAEALLALTGKGVAGGVLSGVYYALSATDIPMWGYDVKERGGRRIAAIEVTASR